MAEDRIGVGTIPGDCRTARFYLIALAAGQSIMGH